MEKMRLAIATLCPHLQIKMSDAKIISESELVFLFHKSEEIEPLFQMLRLYQIDAQIDVLDDMKFLFIYYA